MNARSRSSSSRASRATSSAANIGSGGCPARWRSRSARRRSWAWWRPRAVRAGDFGIRGGRRAIGRPIDVVAAASRGLPIPGRRRAGVRRLHAAAGGRGPRRRSVRRMAGLLRIRGAAAGPAGRGDLSSQRRDHRSASRRPSRTFPGRQIKIAQPRRDVGRAGSCRRAGGARASGTCRAAAIGSSTSSRSSRCMPATPRWPAWSPPAGAAPT